MIGTKKFLKKHNFLKPIDLLMMLYQFIIVILVTIYFKGIFHWLKFAGIHFSVAILVFYFVKFTHSNERRFIKFWRNIYPMVLLIFFYKETTLLVDLVYPHKFDHLFIMLDEKIFGYQPSIEFSKAVSFPLFGEYMYLSYFSYYLILSLPPVIMYFKRDSEKFHKFIFTITLTFFFCYIYFVFCPAAGPQFTIPELIGHPPKGYLFYHIMRFIFEHFEIENGAFPSSHVAIAFVIFLFFVRYFKGVAIIMGIIVAGLCASTVYIHAHYFVDVLAGLTVGLVFYIIAPFIETKAYRYLTRIRKNP